MRRHLSHRKLELPMTTVPRSCKAGLRAPFARCNCGAKSSFRFNWRSGKESNSSGCADFRFTPKAEIAPTMLTAV
jgi:hypothetical protein